MLQVVGAVGHGRSLRVAESGVSLPNEEGLRTIAIDLPVSWAYQMGSVSVVFRDTGTDDMGWHISIQDGDGRVAADFPWWDHADALLRNKSLPFPPIGDTDQPWWDIEQGWYVSVQAAAGQAWIFRTDPDAVQCAEKDPTAVLLKSGMVRIGAIEAWWSAVDLEAYDEAWAAAALHAYRLAP